jgi:23S rRNA (cytosine1962-C5)-methyltransferase
MSSTKTVQRHPQIRLKKDKDILLKNKHPWIYSGAIASGLESCQAGDIVTICTHDGKASAVGFANPSNSLSIRILSFSEITWTEASLYKTLDKAFNRRHLNDTHTTARMVHAEADGLPGLIVDWYDGVAVFQASSAGIQRLKPLIAAHIMTHWHAKACIENTDDGFLKQEGLESVIPLFLGDIPEKARIKEHGQLYNVEVLDSQKTGFYLDQSDNRKRVASLVKAGDTLLNGCAFTGGFSVVAAAHGAITTSVDVSKKALQLAKENFATNALAIQDHQFVAADIFDFLASDKTLYDIVIIDPPAFAKRSDHLPQAIKAYTQLHTLAMQRVKQGGYLLTCSCSHALGWEKYESIIRYASVQSGKDVIIQGRYTQPLDHPILVTHPESEYLRTFLLQIK